MLAGLLWAELRTKTTDAQLRSLLKRGKAADEDFNNAADDTRMQAAAAAVAQPVAIATITVKAGYAEAARRAAAGILEERGFTGINWRARRPPAAWTSACRACGCGRSDYLADQPTQGGNPVSRDSKALPVPQGNRSRKATVTVKAPKPTAAQAVAAQLATRQHVLKATAIGQRVTVEFPRERGGRSSMTLPAAKRLLARLLPAVEVEGADGASAVLTGSKPSALNEWTARYFVKRSSERVTETVAVVEAERAAARDVPLDKATISGTSVKRTATGYTVWVFRKRLPQTTEESTGAVLGILGR